MTEPAALRSGLPLHEQISTWLRERIVSGTLEPHEQLPSEHELCKRFDVSRVTVRRALQTLESDGLIYRRQGLGSFVKDRRVSHGLVRLTDFAQDLARAGLEASSRVLHQGAEPCPPDVATRLEVEPGSPVLRLDRLRLGDGEPVALDRTWLPPFYAQFLEEIDLTNDTIYGILEREFGIPILSGRYRITAAGAEDDVASLLEVGVGQALLIIERTSRSAAARPVYFQRRYYRSDRIAYELELAREPGDPVVGEVTVDEGMPLREFEAVFYPGAGAGEGG
jgi:GntR family transcriptional regulator